MMEKISMKADMVKNLAVFNSDTYQKVINEQTHLYYQSPRYVFSFLEEELRIGKFS